MDSHVDPSAVLGTCLTCFEDAGLGVIVEL